MNNIDNEAEAKSKYDNQRKSDKYWWKRNHYVINQDVVKKAEEPMFYVNYQEST